MWNSGRLETIQISYGRIALRLVLQFPSKPVRVEVEAGRAFRTPIHPPFSSFPEFHIPQSSSTF
jgi:hypothetical protein